ncbi:MAG: PKD domain-containing protein [Gammaproteobacteria bacterium]
MNKPNQNYFLHLIAIYWGFSSTGFAADASHLIGLELQQNRDFVSSAMQGRNYVLQINPDGKIKRVIDTGANGDGLASQQLTSEPTSSAGLPISNGLPDSYQGQDAIDHIGAELPAIAGHYGLTPEKFSEVLLADDSARIDGDNQLFYVDVEYQDNAEPKIKAATTSQNVNLKQSMPIDIVARPSDAFKLHSKAGASKTIYLNFVGYSVTGTVWSKSTLDALPYDLNGRPDVFDDNERRNIISIWSRVAEDYAPFDIDVTTEAPLADALFRNSASDDSYGTQVVITPSNLFNCKCGGSAYVGVVNSLNNRYFQPAWIFQHSLANNEKFIAEAVSHEAGHTLGLLHDGTKTKAYYTGHGTGNTSWAPIMGVGYFKTVTQWSNGDYPDANNLQDDLAVILSKGISARDDDFANSFGQASSLTISNTGTTANVKTVGVIERSDDVDTFILNTLGGRVRLKARPVAVGGNLDIKLALFDVNKQAVANASPNDSLSATIDTSLPGGTYFLTVAGVGRSQSDSGFGYSNYGSLGQYEITGNYQESPLTAGKEPVADISASTLTGPATLVVNFSANNSIGNGNIVGYQWEFGDGAQSRSSNPRHVYSTAGIYTVTLTVTNEYSRANTVRAKVVVTAPPTWDTMQVGLLKLFKSQSSTQATAVIRIVDDNGKPVPDALVAGRWSGAVEGKVGGRTDLNGIVLISSGLISKPGGSETYTILNVSKKGYAYNPSKNIGSVTTLTW